MNEKIIKPGVVKRITDQIKDKNPLCTPEAVDDVLTAFLMSSQQQLQKVTA